MKRSLPGVVWLLNLRKARVNTTTYTHFETKDANPRSVRQQQANNCHLSFRRACRNMKRRVPVHKLKLG
jgi:hypothetical protein